MIQCFVTYSNIGEERSFNNLPFCSKLLGFKGPQSKFVNTVSSVLTPLSSNCRMGVLPNFNGRLLLEETSGLPAY